MSKRVKWTCIAAAIVVTPVVWTVIASYLLVGLGRLWEQFPVPLTTWWLYLSWWHSYDTWTKLMIFISGLMPTGLMVLGGIVWWQHHASRATEKLLYGKTEWASRQQAVKRGFHFTDRL